MLQTHDERQIKVFIFNLKVGIGKVGTPPFTRIDDILYVDGLMHKLLIISQLRDKDLKINFNKDTCIKEDKFSNENKLIEKIINNIFMIYMEDLSLKLKSFNNNNDGWLWHKRIVIYRDHLNKLIKHDFVIGLPKMKFDKDKSCDTCHKGKQTKFSFWMKMLSLHLNLFD